MNYSKVGENFTKILRRKAWINIVHNLQRGSVDTTFLLSFWVSLQMSYFSKVAEDDALCTLACRWLRRQKWLKREREWQYTAKTWEWKIFKWKSFCKVAIPLYHTVAWKFATNRDVFGRIRWPYWLQYSNSFRTQRYAAAVPSKPLNKERL